MPETVRKPDDENSRDRERVFLAGVQALVRLPLLQRQRDLAAGLNTAGFISGYRGSPLGRFDHELWKAGSDLEAHHVRFQPGVNEDLSATAVWGSQQSALHNDQIYDGVFALWYGKGPGVDRSGDGLKHGNLAGSAAKGGVLCLAGDDHTCRSSTTAHQSEVAFIDAMIPLLYPAGVQEFLDFGLLGWAMSRFSGCWVGFKTISETVESAAGVSLPPVDREILLPSDFPLPPDGLNIRAGDNALAQEERLHGPKMAAVLAFARANKLDRVVLDSPKRRLGIVTVGKSYLDVRQALDDLAIDAARAAEIGLCLYKVGMSWPLEKDGLRRFAEGLDEILVVEEKRAILENQIKEQLYNWRADTRPRVIGKHDENGELILPSFGELSPARIARVIAQRIARFHSSEAIESRLAFLREKEKALESEAAPVNRVPYFCSGCPHNTSTRLPEGSRALAGIGCHYMVRWMDRNTDAFTQMGAEGANWIGQAPFCNTRHVFVNIGDGTYFHSGILALRACIAAGVNITFKILYNDAVAMTGGQPMDGPLDPAMITRQVHAEGVGRIVVVSEDITKYPIGTKWAPGVEIRPREELDSVQRDLRELPGTTVLLYDQTCAAEKRRRRKSGTYPDPDRRVFINAQVCEGCGDCSKTSNCLSVLPLETPLGRKRQIEQSSCNKDFSCLNGFCPSFVTLQGGRLRRNEARPEGAAPWPDLPEPALPDLAAPYGILITGVGGTGIVTLGDVIAKAAHSEGKGCTVLDITGLAQKGGAVTSQVRIAAKQSDLHAVRIAAGGARLLLGCDQVVAAGFDARSKLDPGKSRAVVNTQEAITGEFMRDPEFRIPSARLRTMIDQAIGPGGAEYVNATRLATALMGDAIATNFFMLGYAWQKGLVPVGLPALEQAIGHNGKAAADNLRAFLWGRRTAVDAAGVTERALGPKSERRDTQAPQGLEALTDARAAFLTEYQDGAYARRYRGLVEKAAAKERALGISGEPLSLAVAEAYFKLLAYKDEYEVARLHLSPEFRAALEESFEGDYSLRYHLAPPLLARRDPASGQLLKREFGPWLHWVFRVLAPMKRLRGGPFDPFGYSLERRRERQLIADYESLITEILRTVSPENLDSACALAALPLEIKGFGHVKLATIERTAQRRHVLLQAFRQGAKLPQGVAGQ